MRTEVKQRGVPPYKVYGCETTESHAQSLEAASWKKALEIIFDISSGGTLVGNHRIITRTPRIVDAKTTVVFDMENREDLNLLKSLDDETKQK